MMEEQPESPYQPPALPVTPPAMPLARSSDPFVTTQDDRTMGMLLHLLALLTGFLGPLIIWLVKKDQSRFIDHHGKESLNFMITCFLASLVGIAFAVVTMGIGMIVVFPLFIMIWVGSLVFEIMACIAANRGEWYRMPITIRFIS
jgi:uncharacterized Tic20 family protein